MSEAGAASTWLAVLMLIRGTEHGSTRAVTISCNP
jgi:hypothetical protein